MKNFKKVSIIFVLVFGLFPIGLAAQKVSLPKALEYYKKGMKIFTAEEREDYYNQAIKYYPNFANAWDELGNVYFHKGYRDKPIEAYYKKAIEAYSEAIALNPNKAESYLNRGCIKEKLGDKKGATSDYKIAAACKAYTEVAITSVAGALYLLGDQKGALAAYEKILDRMFYLNNFTYMPVKSFGLCADVLIEKRMDNQLNIKNLRDTQKAFLHRLRGAFLTITTSSSARADNEYKKLMEINPSSVEPYKYWLAAVLRNKNIPKYKSLAVLYAQRGDNIHTQYINARVKFIENKSQEAAEILTTLLKSNPGFTPAYYLRAECYSNLGMWALALVDLEKSRQTTLVLHHKAFVKKMLGDMSGSQKDLAHKEKMIQDATIGLAPY